MKKTPGSGAESLIGMFDSGVGGLSILRALRERLPGASLLYVGDAAWAPYGARSTADLLFRCATVVTWLVEQGATMVVVACNTATVTAIDTLRARWPELVFIGVEPGIKPAAAQSKTRRIAVMSTVATARSDRLRRLIETHAKGAQVHIEACPGLASAVERGEFEGPGLERMLRPHGEAIRAAKVDTVVLGCTHYAFIAQAIRTALGAGVTLIDTAHAIADRGAGLWSQHSLAIVPSPRIRVLSTGATETMQRLTDACPGLDSTRVERLRL